MKKSKKEADVCEELVGQSSKRDGGGMSLTKEEKCVHQDGLEERR